MTKIFKNFGISKKIEASNFSNNNIEKNYFSILNINSFVKTNFKKFNKQDFEYLCNHYSDFYNDEIDYLHKISFAMKKLYFKGNNIISKYVDIIFILLGNRDFSDKSINDIKDILIQFIECTENIYNNNYIPEFENNYNVEQVIKNDYYSNEEFIEIIHKVGNKTFEKIVQELVNEKGRNLSVQETKNLLHIKNIFEKLLKKVEKWR